MTNQSTMDKLIEMRLTTMADAFRNQLNDPKFKEVPFEDQFGMLVDIEYSSRKNNRLKRRLFFRLLYSISTNIAKRSSNGISLNLGSLSWLRNASAIDVRRISINLSIVL